VQTDCLYNQLFFYRSSNRETEEKKIENRDSTDCFDRTVLYNCRTTACIADKTRVSAKTKEIS